MLRIVLFIAFVACAQAAILPTGRIIGGTPADITEAPYTVAILYDTQNIGTFIQACGGVIITRTTVLTSAQCATFLPRQIRVRAGSSFHNSGGQLIPVSSLKQHESFVPNTFNNDIAVLHLAAQIVLGDSAETITLPAQNAPIADGLSCLVSGWGSTTDGEAPPANLHKMSVPTVNQTVCVDAYSGFMPVTTNMFCAGRQEVGGVDFCIGDTGGPLAIGGILYGTISWGRCGQPQFPGVYTRIPMYTNWILNNQ